MSLTTCYLGEDSEWYIRGSNVPCKDGCRSAKTGLRRHLQGVECGYCGSHWIMLDDEIHPDPDPNGGGLPEGWKWEDDDAVKEVR